MVLHEDIPQVRNNEVSAKPPAKVRVTFYESQKPHYVSSPETPDDLDLPIMASPSPSQDKTGYIRQDRGGEDSENLDESDFNLEQRIKGSLTESGRDNPFRPDGDLSKEADEIVELIKEGKPIVGTPSRHVRDITDHMGNGGEGLTAVTPESVALLQANEMHATSSPANTESPSTPNKAMNNVGGYDKKSGINGTAPTTAVTPEAIEVQHGIVVPPSDASQVEHVVIKKKPKCKCCEIM